MTEEERIRRLEAAVYVLTSSLVDALEASDPTAYSSTQMLLGRLNYIGVTPEEGEAAYNTTAMANDRNLRARLSGRRESLTRAPERTEEE